MNCESCRELLPAYLDESLDETKRGAFRDHLRSCSECRTTALRTEPTLALVLSPRREPSDERVEACVAAVMAGVRQERLQRQLRPSRRAWLAAAAAIVIALTVSAAWWINRGESVAEPTLQAEAQPVETNGPAVEAAPPMVDPPPRVEIDMTQEEVRVYQYAIGEDDSTGAVFIVNPAMEL